MYIFVFFSIPSCSLSRHQSLATKARKSGEFSGTRGGWGKVKKLAEEKKLEQLEKQGEGKRRGVGSQDDDNLIPDSPEQPRPTKHVSKAEARQNQRRIRQIRKRKRREFETGFMVNSQVYSELSF